MEMDRQYIKEWIQKHGKSDSEISMMKKSWNEEAAEIFNSISELEIAETERIPVKETQFSNNGAFSICMDMFSKKYCSEKDISIVYSKNEIGDDVVPTFTIVNKFLINKNCEMKHEEKEKLKIK
jgi:hypothetical protein